MAAEVVGSALINRAKSLPVPLVRFLARWPSPALQSAAPKSSPGLDSSSPASTDSTPSDLGTSDTDASTPPVSQILTASDTTVNRNPFEPWRHPSTGRWRPPVYSMRQQRELCKMAADHGVEELLWASKKATWFKEKKLIEQGLRLRNAGPGKRVKGHKWERTLSSRLEERRQAMLGMPAMIEEWKRLGHGRGWKKWPK
ncbi:hypothetical protein P152DRAFT_455714 [Eremomyces bilateralis CBS 781.70]|uniref:Large ribosomal subunit protein mL59 domain-containing protein n=1 Tax=Eremomyces bilateralis CBS 781.70 TaxID=1392243 RepID=A0A6G1GD92_9PEZI|nr:uncharacterized protein P152DRAFT_455714 [Eremomyces bilateralis CBS 781.70]KAF1815994.1 hypothetical protein P152DRAFT_455714 [Eremomyces bilateralis CBS 781.70]